MLMIVCPDCLGELEEGVERWRCLACGATYRGLLGIPDLRTAEDQYLSNCDDWALANHVAADYDRLDFLGLLGRYFDLSREVPPDLRGRQIAHILSAPERCGQWIDALGGTLPQGPFLDLGCGSGSFLVHAARGRSDVYGLDIAMRWLVVARKRLDEAGHRHVRLVCGCAEKPPFRARSFHTVIAGDVIEHVADQSRTLEEAHRVLTPGGKLVLASPNRYSLAPEPHVGVWGVGFLPRRWMSAYVRWARGCEFRAIRTLGLVEWRHLLAASAFGGGSISCPALPQADLAGFAPVKRRLGEVYNRLVASRAGQVLARRFGPLFHVVCTRGEDLAVPSSPTTRPHSTRTRAPG
jgi:SAM-dependent methyltransferase